MAKPLDESWKSWTKENIGLGVPHKTIFKTLTENDFDLKEIVETMQWSPDKQDIIQVSPKKDTQIISKNVYIDGAEKVEVKDNVLEIYKVDNFLSEVECDELVKMIKSNMKKSQVSIANKAHGYVDDSVRTSSTCNLMVSSGKVVKQVDDRILSCIGLHSSRGEPIQGQHYDVTQEFKQHTDTFQPNSDEYRLHCKKSGQRTWTFMIYLDSPEEGGETKFNLTKTPDGKKLSFSPQKGQAVLWNNLNADGSPNRYSTHQGSPVVTGEKTIITKWFRERKV